MSSTCLSNDLDAFQTIRSGEYGSWGSISHHNSLIFSIVNWTVWGRVLSMFVHFHIRSTIMHSCLQIIFVYIFNDDKPYLIFGLILFIQIFTQIIFSINTKTNRSIGKTNNHFTYMPGLPNIFPIFHYRFKQWQDNNMFPKTSYNVLW